MKLNWSKIADTSEWYKLHAHFCNFSFSFKAKKSTIHNILFSLFAQSRNYISVHGDWPVLAPGTFVSPLVCKSKHHHIATLFFSWRKLEIATCWNYTTNITKHIKGCCLLVIWTLNCDTTDSAKRIFSKVFIAELLRNETKKKLELNCRHWHIDSELSDIFCQPRKCLHRQRSPYNDLSIPFLLQHVQMRVIVSFHVLIWTNFRTVILGPLSPVTAK
jgi:hypothetical protein